MRGSAHVCRFDGAQSKLIAGISSRDLAPTKEFLTWLSERKRCKRQQSVRRADENGRMAKRRPFGGGGSHPASFIRPTPKSANICMTVRSLHYVNRSIQKTYPVLRSTCSWQVTTYVGKPSAIGQPTRPTQPFIICRSINE